MTHPDPIGAYMDEVRARHAGARDQRSRLMAAVADAQDRMGLAPITPEDPPPSPDQAHWAQHLAEGGFLGIIRIQNNQLFVPEAERMDRQSVATVVDGAAVSRLAPGARVYAAGEGPWIEDGSLCVFVAQEAEWEALWALGTRLVLPAWQARMGLHIVRQGPVAADLPLKLAVQRRARRRCERDAQGGRELADAVGEGKKALCAILAIEGIPGAEALQGPWLAPLLSFLRKAQAQKEEAQHAQKALEKADLAVAKAWGQLRGNR